MERLTFEGNFCDIAQCRELPCQHKNTCSQKQVWERLKAYEDTHMMPSDVTSMRMDMAIIAALFNGVDVDRMKELAEADKNGCVIIVPCKVGDTVWFNTYKDNGKTCIGIRPHKVISTGAYITAEGEILPVELPVSRFGENWFRTREEAEKALEAMKK